MKKLSQYSNSRLLLFSVIAALYLIKLFLFDVLCVPVVTIIEYSGFSWSAGNWLAKITVSMLCASMVLVTNKRWPNIVLMLILDAWIVANLTYYKLNLLYLNWGVIRQATNLIGFEDSIAPLMSYKMLLFPAITILAELLMLRIKACQRPNWKAIVAVFVAIVACEMATLGLRARFVHQRCGKDSNAEVFSILKLPEVLKIDRSAIELETTYYIQMHSIAMYLVRECCHALQFHKDDISLTEQEQAFLATRIREKNDANPVEGHLVYVMLESFESWLLEEKDANGDYVCHRLHDWMERHPHLLSMRMRSQHLYGQSGDGQLINMTGLLPIEEGVACNDYGTNVYPNFAHFYDNAVLINPMRGVWNQDVVTYSYGFRKIIQSTQADICFGNDDVIFDTAIRELENADVPTCLLALSFSMHMPFERATLPLDLDPNLPTIVANYLKSARYTDEYLGNLLEWIEQSPKMANATIIITADHNILNSDLDPNPSHYRYLPFIVVSPRITENKVIKEVTNQIDIFPTVLHVINQDNYYWRGFGENLLQNDIRRTISESEAYTLSDKLIRMNYMSNYE